MMFRSRPGRVRCALGLTFVPVLAYALLGSLGACDYVAYVGNYDIPDGTVTDAGPDVDADIDASVPCGPKSCFAPATCLDPQGEGKCSNDIMSISAGGETTCAFLADASLWCWGGNQFGALGLSSEGDSQCDPGDGTRVACRHKPSPVPGMNDVIHVSAGLRSVCAVKRDNSLWCWGNNHFGQLGHAPNTAGDRLCPMVNEGTSLAPAEECNSVPTRVEGLSAIEVVVNRDHACAIKTDGLVVCWGKNQSYALGTQAIGQGEATHVPQPVDSLKKSLHLATGISSYHTCAIVGERQQVWCWGANNFNELGHPKTRDTECSGNCSFKASPVVQSNGDAAADVPLDKVTELAVGYTFACALRDGRVYCWGSNDFGTLGKDAVGSSNPNQIQALPLARGLGGRFIHACAATEEQRVFCWGANLLGAVGTGDILGERCKETSACRLSPYNTTLDHVVGIAVGASTSYALFDKRWAISAWGDNSTARLGHPQNEAGDFTNCGDIPHESVCNATPRPIPRFP
ncbi:hypothetical protein LVJ94_37520 [Pendulispora rubella]|uniref:BNR repeat domain protein n=1 Tax=Pendulispora rubella TaxID=2741070 RepID=A0ABZ2KV90_9BACT